MPYNLSLKLTMAKDWNQYAEEWDTNPDAVSYCEHAYGSLLAAVNLTGLDVLDFGCGTGLLTEKIAKKAKLVVGLDSSEKMITVLENKRMPNVELVAAELTEEAMRTNPHLQKGFGLITASSVCAFLPDFEGTLCQFRRLLQPNGLLIQWDWLALEGDQGSGFAKEQVISAYQQAGFVVSSISVPFSIDSMAVLMGVATNA